MIYREQDQNLRRIIYGLYNFDISGGKQNDFEGRILDSYSKEEKKADFTCDCEFVMTKIFIYLYHHRRRQHFTLHVI